MSDLGVITESKASGPCIARCLPRTPRWRCGEFGSVAQQLLNCPFWNEVMSFA